MIRATWLLRRTAALLLLGVAVSLSAVLVLDGLGAGPPYANETPTMAFTVKHVLQVLLFALPCLLGVFGAAPLLGQEAEMGTLHLGWTQSVTRGRWTGVTLGLTLGAAVAAAGMLAAVGTWWATQWLPWAGNGMWGDFDLVGPALVAYTTFAVAAGLAFGAVIGRTLPAMILTLFAYVGLRVLVEVGLRPRFLPSLSFSDSLGTPGAGDPASQAWATGFGQGGVSLYQPAGRFWLFQGIEAAIFLVLAGILMAVAAWWLTRRFA